MARKQNTITSSKCREPKHSGAQVMVPLTLAAAMCMPWALPVQAMSAQCSQNLQFGRLFDCGNGGKLAISPSGVLNTISGCFSFIDVPKQAICKVSSFVTTGTLKIEMSAKKMVMTGPPDTMRMSVFNIGTPLGGTQKTYTSASLTTTPFSFGIGGRLRVTGNQATGSYLGKMSITVTFTN